MVAQSPKNVGFAGDISTISHSGYQGLRVKVNIASSVIKLLQWSRMNVASVKEYFALPTCEDAKGASGCSVGIAWCLTSPLETQPRCSACIAQGEWFRRGRGQNTAGLQVT